MTEKKFCTSPLLEGYENEIKYLNAERARCKFENLRYKVKAAQAALDAYKEEYYNVVCEVRVSDEFETYNGDVYTCVGYKVMDDGNVWVHGFKRRKNGTYNFETGACKEVSSTNVKRVLTPDNRDN